MTKVPASIAPPPTPVSPPSLPSVNAGNLRLDDITDKSSESVARTSATSPVSPPPLPLQSTEVVQPDEPWVPLEDPDPEVESQSPPFAEGDEFETAWHSASFGLRIVRWGTYLALLGTVTVAVFAAYWGNQINEFGQAKVAKNASTPILQVVEGVLEKLLFGVSVILFIVGRVFYLQVPKESSARLGAQLALPGTILYLAAQIFCWVLFHKSTRDGTFDRMLIGVGPAIVLWLITEVLFLGSLQKVGRHLRHREVGRSIMTFWLTLTGLVAFSTILAFVFQDQLSPPKLSVRFTSAGPVQEASKSVHEYIINLMMATALAAGLLTILLLTYLSAINQTCRAIIRGPK